MMTPNQHAALAQGRWFAGYVQRRAEEVFPAPQVHVNLETSEKVGRPMGLEPTTSGTTNLRLVPRLGASDPG